jgi:hypothetical protein
MNAEERGITYECWIMRDYEWMQKNAGLRMNAEERGIMYECWRTRDYVWMLKKAGLRMNAEEHGQKRSRYILNICDSKL